MIFRPELAKKIRAGGKTQTRRIVKPGEKQCRYVPGKAYAIQPGRGKESIGRLTITAVRQEHLGALTLLDAKREGFVTTQEFFDYWRELHGSVNPDLPVWVISFDLGDLTDTARFLSARVGGAGGDYTTIPALAANGEGESLTEHEQTRFSTLAHARDEQRLISPLQDRIDEITAQLGTLYELLPSQNSPIRNSIRRLEREMEILNKKLAA